VSQPTYLSSDGYIGESFFTLSYDVALDAAHPPPLNAFEVQVNGTEVSVTAVAVDSIAHTVALTFNASALIAGDFVEFSYVDPTAGNDANAIQGLDGTDAATFASWTIVAGSRPAPSAPPTPVLSAGSDSGTLGDDRTSDATPTITGTAAASNTVKLYDSDGTTLLGTTTADGSGAWSITASTLSEGDHALKVVQVDSFNSTSPLSAGLVVHIDTTAPAAPFAAAMTSASDTGASSSDGITSDTTPIFSGASEANAIVRLYDTDGTTMLGSAQADGSGHWSITSSSLSEGDHTLTATATDAAGNVSTAGAGLTAHIDTTAPDIQSIAPVGGPATAATSVVETVTFSESVTGVDVSDFTVSGAGTASGQVASVTGSGATYTVTIDTVAGEGAIHLDLNGAATGIADTAGNAIASGLTGTSVTIDHVAPTVVDIVPSTVGPTSATALTQTVTFSESVTGVDASDFTIGHTGTATAHIDSVTGSGANYTVTLDAVSGDGTIHLDLNASGTGIADEAGNAIAGGATGTSATIAQPPPPPDLPPPTSGGDDVDILDLRSDGLSQVPHTYAGQGGADVIYGGDAGDTLQGNTGDDMIQGGAGVDLIYGGQGDDQLDGGAGNDLMFGNLGDDSVAGGAGNDTLQGNTGADTLAGGAGNDVVLGGQDQDRLEGGEGGDFLSGDLGNDSLQGNTGADTLEGGAGNDVLLGGQGEDRLEGGDGDDYLSGDLGNDTLTGGAGADVFSFAPGGGVDHVTDFHAADGDRVQLQHGAAYTLAQVGADTVVDLGHGDQVILDNVQLSTLPAGWILN
jgi:Ca2+-binding RTX toxin-like protein